MDASARERKRARGRRERAARVYRLQVCTPYTGARAIRSRRASGAKATGHEATARWLAVAREQLTPSFAPTRGRTSRERHEGERPSQLPSRAAAPNDYEAATHCRLELVDAVACGGRDQSSSRVRKGRKGGGAFARRLPPIRRRGSRWPLDSNVCTAWSRLFTRGESSNACSWREGERPSLSASCAAPKENTFHSAPCPVGDSTYWDSETPSANCRQRTSNERMYCNRVRSIKKGMLTSWSRHEHGTGPIERVPLGQRSRPAPS